MKTILVTGATSYLGRHLRPELEKSYAVHVLVRPGSVRPELPESQIHLYDGTPASMRRAFEKQKYDAVIHLAAKALYKCSADDIPDFIAANITLGTLLLQNMADNGCRKLLNACSFWQEYSAQLPVPNSIYAATKTAFDAMIETFVLAHDLNCISLRLFDVYGPNDHRPKVLQQVLEGKTARVPLTLGEQEIYLTHVHDVVRAFQTSLEMLLGSNDHQHVKYDVRGESTTLRRAVEHLIQIKEISPKLDWGALQYRKTQIMSPMKRTVLPGWQPQVSIEQGLRDL